MTKIHALTVPGLSLFVSLASFIAMLVMPYLEGRSNSIWAVPPMLPAEVVPLLLLLIGCIVSFCYGVGAVLARRHIIGAILIFLASLFLLVASVRIDHGGIYLRGFRDYAATILTPDEWREIDHFAREHMKPDEPLAGPEKGLWENRELWSEFTTATQIKKLPPSLVISVGSRGTTIEWGGALVGHRAVVISDNANEQMAPNKLPRPKSVARGISVCFLD